RAPEDAVGVDRPPPRGLRPLRAVAAAEGADGARIVLTLAARGAALDHQLAGGRRVPEGLGLGIDRRSGDRALGGAHASLRPMMRVALPARGSREPPVPWASAMSQFFTWTLGCASPRSWRTAS